MTDTESNMLTYGEHIEHRVREQLALDVLDSMNYEHEIYSSGDFTLPHENYLGRMWAWTHTLAFTIDPKNEFVPGTPGDWIGWCRWTYGLEN